MNKGGTLHAEAHGPSHGVTEFPWITLVEGELPK
jgi:hypothetical protein